ncbi:MAG TPA: ABC transporter permease [Bryobacteraceae bacterium]|jgi:putative ABC transport system permease protein|nr:ABC transporter permease [Bryobacteraceae bacterium]
MFAKDLLHATRGLRKSPSFALISIGTIALGIGASTAIFSVVNAVLLQPLPYRDAGRLALIESDMRHRNVVDFPFSGPDFDDMVHQTTQFEEIGAIFSGRAAVRDDNGEPALLTNGAVTPNFFHILGARVILGRDFIAGDATPQAPPAAGAAAPPRLPAIAILSYDLWKRRYGGDPGVIGRSIELGGGAQAQIVGVLEPEFELLFPPASGVERKPELWTALRANFATGGRNDVFLHLIGRLKPGASVETAQAEANRFAADLRKHFVIKETAGLYIRVEPMRQHLVDAVRPAILAIMGAVLFLLLIACANVANLLLIRAASRGRELAVRAALGGGRWDLVRQMMAESLLLAGSGALLGLLLASKGVDLLIYLAPANLPRLDSVAIDPAVLVFTVVVAAFSAVLFGVMPALRASRPDIMDVLRASGRTSGLGRGRMLRDGVVMAEVALSFVLLVGSGLMVRTFLAIVHTDPGFRADGVLTFLMPILRQSPEQRNAAENDFQNRMRALPGVTAASAANSLPLDGGNPLARWGTQEAMADPARFHQANFIFMLPGYFEAIGTKLVAGRVFTDADNKQGLHQLVIDQQLASKAFPHDSAVGKRLLCRITTPEPEWFEVIGVVQHERHDSLLADGHDEAYVMDGYGGFGAATRWAVRTSGDPMKLVPMVREEIAKFDRRLAVAEMHPMSAFVDRAQAQTRFALVLIGVFAAIAALLAAVGLYGVLASAVRQRTAEIGVRVALGAAPLRIFGLVVGQGMALSAAGIAIGMVAAFALTRAMSSMLVGVKPTDPLTFAAMAGAFLLVAAIASWIPARRAAGLDPTNALREE